MTTGIAVTDVWREPARVHSGRRLAIATAEVVNGDGEQVAIATRTTLLGSSPAAGGA